MEHSLRIGCAKYKVFWLLPDIFPSVSNNRLDFKGDPNHTEVNLGSPFIFDLHKTIYDMEFYHLPHE